MQKSLKQTHESKGEGSKNKRSAERQIRKDEDEDENVKEEDTGSFQKADEATIAGRRKISIRRKNQPEEVAAKPIAFPTFNFATQVGLEEKKEESKKEESKKEDEKEKEENTKESEEKDQTTGSPSIKTGTFSFSTQFSFTSTTSPSLFSIPVPSFPPVSNLSTGSSVFGENIAKPATIPSPQKSSEEPTSPVKAKLDLPTVPVSSGEEGEHHVFQNRMKVYLLDGKEWKERGVGILKINVADDNSYARLIMRAEGALRLVLNVRLFPNMKIEPVGDKAARFVASHMDNPSELGTYLVRASKPEFIKELTAAVDAHKVLKGTNPTEENEVKSDGK